MGLTTNARETTSLTDRLFYCLHFLGRAPPPLSLISNIEVSEIEPRHLDSEDAKEGLPFPTGQVQLRETHPFARVRIGS